MTNVKFFEVFGEISERHIVEAWKSRKARRGSGLKWAAMAACLAVILAVVPVMRWVSRQEPTVSLIINALDAVEESILREACMDLDGSSYWGLGEAELAGVKEEFYQALGIAYDEFTGRMGKEFTLVHFGALFIPSRVEPREDGFTEERRLHDYHLSYRTSTGGSIDIYLCAFDKPLRDVIIGECGFVDSQIGETMLKIYGSSGYYIAEFTHESINYYIQANGITETELQAALCGIVLH